MPTLNLSVSNDYAVQASLPNDTPINIQNIGSYLVELYIGSSAPTTQSGVELDTGDMVTVTISTGESLYTKTKQEDTLGRLVGVY